jgi:hypothetical protein
MPPPDSRRQHSGQNTSSSGADAAITYSTYAHLFDRAERPRQAAAKLNASHGRLLASNSRTTS